MFKELADDLGCTVPDHGTLEALTAQGALLLNAKLTTVGESSSNSHKGRGWERFTDAVIEAPVGQEVFSAPSLFPRPTPRSSGLGGD